MSFFHRLQRRTRDAWHLARFAARRRYSGAPSSIARRTAQQGTTNPVAPRILVIDSALPQFDRDAGGRMTFQYLELLAEMGYQVQFMPDDGHRAEPYASLLEARGIEVLAGPEHRGSWPEVLTAAPNLEFVWLSRPLVAMKYLDDVRRLTTARVLYSLVDLHYVREARRAELTGNPVYRWRSHIWNWLERSLVRQADVALSVSEDEIAELRRTEPGANVTWLPLYVQPAEPPTEWLPRPSDDAVELLFVGNFRHAPNVDAAHWLLTELWPAMARELPDARLHIVGSAAPEWLRSQNAPGVQIHDSISDEALHALYERSRVALVPLRFGAGAKGKTLEAMQRGVALVSTRFGVEGLPRDRQRPTSCDDARAFVARAVQLCRDDRAREEAVRRQRQYLSDHFSREAARSRVEAILTASRFRTSHKLTPRDIANSSRDAASNVALPGKPAVAPPSSARKAAIATETGKSASDVMPAVSLNFAAAAELRRAGDIRDLDIGVIYTHERHFVPPLLTTLAASGAGLRMRLWLIDNQSADGAGQWTPLFPETRVLKNDRRMNYAENLNRVLEVAHARYVLLLNTDMYFDPADQCLARMVTFMDAHPECGLASCRLVHPDGEEAHAGRRFQTLGVIAARRLGLGRVSQKLIERYLCLDQQGSETHECDWVSGCFLLLRREAHQQVGPFDTRFGKYFEDVDMALRIGRAGWTVMQNRATKCFHWEQRGSARVWSRDAWRHLRAYAIWLRKWGWMPGSGVQRLRAARRRAA